MAAASNINRPKRVFHGSLELYKKWNLKYYNVFHVLSSRNELEVNEYYIKYSLEETCKNNKILLIDHIEDPRNLGSIIRSAAAFGYNILLRERCPINETVVHCASGGIEHVKITVIKNTKEILNRLKGLGFFLIGLDERAEDITSFTHTEKFILCIGSESGLSELVKNSCDVMLKLKTKSIFTTLNASVAASLAMCHFQ